MSLSITEQVDAHIDELRAKFPGLEESYWAETRDRMIAERTLNDQREKLFFLVGYYERAGAVPVEKLQMLLDGGDPR